MKGTISRRKTKTMGVVYDFKYRTADGTQIKKCAGSSRQEAQRQLNAALTAVESGLQRTTSTEKFSPVADRWLAQKKPRIEASTYNDYEIHLRKRLKPAFGDRKLREITRARIETYLAEQDAESGLSRKTLNDSLIHFARSSVPPSAKECWRRTPPRTTTATTRWSFPMSARR
jgi:hypothetical protein